MPTTSNNVDCFAETVSSGGGLSTDFGLAYFGDGTDGNVTITNLTTATREQHYNNLTITSTGTLKVAGYRIFVRGTLTIEAGGSINDDGVTATGPTGAAGVLPKNYLGGGFGGGGSGATNGIGNIGSGSGGNSSLNDLGGVPAGGAGGAGGANAGGNGGSASQPTPWQKWQSQAFWGAAKIMTTNGTERFNGGAGGGGGGSNNASANGGGGGTGGGVVWVAAKTVSNAGRISANGGQGGPGTGTAGAGGGGGGGGGGAVALVTQSTAYGLLQANGGTGGIGFGGGITGVTGARGCVAVLVLA